jgi:hypothetical protein
MKRLALLVLSAAAGCGLWLLLNAEAAHADPSPVDVGAAVDRDGQDGLADARGRKGHGGQAGKGLGVNLGEMLARPTSIAAPKLKPLKGKAPKPAKVVRPQAAGEQRHHEDQHAKLLVAPVAVLPVSSTGGSGWAPIAAPAAGDGMPAARASPRMSRAGPGGRSKSRRVSGISQPGCQPPGPSQPSAGHVVTVTVATAATGRNLAAHVRASAVVDHAGPDPEICGRATPPRNERATGRSVQRAPPPPRCAPDHGQSHRDDQEIDMLKAVIYLPEGPDMRRWERMCLNWCSSHDYQLVGLVRDNRDQTHWQEVQRMMVHGRAEVVVVASYRHLPQNAVPRVEAASRAMSVVSAQHDDLNADD